MRELTMTLVRLLETIPLEAYKGTMRGKATRGQPLQPRAKGFQELN